MSQDIQRDWQLVRDGLDQIAGHRRRAQKTSKQIRNGHGGEISQHTSLLDDILGDFTL